MKEIVRPSGRISVRPGEIPTRPRTLREEQAQTPPELLLINDDTQGQLASTTAVTSRGEERR